LIGISYAILLKTVIIDIYKTRRLFAVSYYGYYGLGWLGWLIIVGVRVGLAFIPANIAGKKGYSYGGFWVFGFFLFLPALIVALCINTKQPYGQPYQQPYYTQQPPPPGQDYGQSHYGPSYGQNGYAPPYPPPGSESRCPRCGQPYQPGDAFCAKCGNKL